VENAGSEATHGVIQISKQTFHPQKPLSDETLSWVKSHVTECLTTHCKCLNTSETILPRRVLSLTKTPSGTIQVTLKETDGTRGAYTCLSHRWGGSELGMTTRETYADWLNGIPWRSIPSTFQDAIRFTVSMGIENIWIDSFCIIQDDRLDWEEQAETMASIYQNSFITLAATTSPDNESGCFWDSDTSYERNFQTDIGVFSVRRIIRHWKMLWTSHSATTFPLLTRAWVFQERLLAPRVLHFSGNEFIWECMQLGDCQCGGYDAASNPKTHNWTGGKPWRSAVELYTSLHLTSEQDRLPALFGFAYYYARSIGASIEKEYFAGLWENSFYQDLLWRVESLAVKLDTKMIRLCRCFDLIICGIEADLCRRCQYSYSAACSIQCLKQRRFCRYGRPEAAVPYLAKFSGSCLERENSTTSIQRLRQWYEEQGEGSIREDDCYLAPSWSWVSVRTRVKFWKDISHIPNPRRVPNPWRERNSPCIITHVQVDHNGQRLAGPVCAAVLRLDGWMTPAMLQYHYFLDPSDKSIQHHSIFRYSLTVDRSRQPLEFYPDYVLCFEGDRWIPNGTPVFILHITSGVYLVLQGREYFKSSQKSRVGRVFSKPAWDVSLPTKFNGGSYVRIGVLRSPGGSKYETYLNSSWITNIEIE
jgi:hypothetical protein